MQFRSQSHEHFQYHADVVEPHPGIPQHTAVRVPGVDVVGTPLGDGTPLYLATTGGFQVNNIPKRKHCTVYYMLGTLLW